MPVTAPPEGVARPDARARGAGTLAPLPHPGRARGRALLMAAQGASNTEIAQRCGVTPRTVARGGPLRGGGTSTVHQAGRGLGPPTVLSPAAVRALLVPSAPRRPRGPRPEPRCSAPSPAPSGEAGRPLGMAGLYLGAAQRAVALRDGPASNRSTLRCAAHNDYLAFLRRLDWHVPGTERIHLVLDRISPQVAHFAVDRWLGNPRRRRFETSVVPDPGLWIELVRAAAGGRAAGGVRVQGRPMSAAHPATSGGRDGVAAPRIGGGGPTRWPAAPHAVRPA